MNNSDNIAYRIRTKVKLVQKFVSDRTGWIKNGSVGVVIDQAMKAVLVRFENGDRWCWPDELEII